MSSLAELLQKIVLLTSNVDSLKVDVKRLVDKAAELNDRVVRLENSGDLIAEKAKNAALMGAQAMNGEILKEVYGVKARVEALSKPSAISVALPLEHHQRPPFGKEVE